VNDPILLGGLGCVFLAAVLAVVSLTYGRRQRKEVNRSLEAIATFRASPRVLRDYNQLVDAYNRGANI